VFGVIHTKVSNGIARSRIDLTYVFIRNVPPSSGQPYQPSKMSKFTATTPLIFPEGKNKFKKKLQESILEPIVEQQV
jgi:hypothetical protein